MTRILLSTLYMIVAVSIVIFAISMWVFPFIFGYDWGYLEVIGLAAILWFVLPYLTAGIMYLCYSLPVSIFGHNRLILFDGAVIVVIISMLHLLYNTWTVEVEYTGPRILLAVVTSLYTIYYAIRFNFAMHSTRDLVKQGKFASDDFPRNKPSRKTLYDDTDPNDLPWNQ